MRRAPSADLIGGFVLLIVGLVFFIVSFSYPLGTARNIGPAGFPMLASGVLVLVSLGVIVGALRGAGGAIAQADLRAVATIFGGVLAFAAAMVLAGFVPAVFAAVFIAALGTSETGPVARIVLAAAAAAACWAVFIAALGLPIPAFRWAL